MIKLEKMNKLDFDDYISIAINAYAIEKVKAGTWSEEEAYKCSEESFKNLLPDGIDTEREYLYSIFDEDNKIKVGYLWVECVESLIGKTAFIFDFLIFEEFRSKGYGTQSMKALEEVARKLGICKVSLHVFAHNSTAIALYEKVGFRNTDIHMSKYIETMF
jgi:ribosomal protein S18 acetylase RimI-like enzyme